MSKRSRSGSPSCLSPRRRAAVAVIGGDGRGFSSSILDDVRVRVCASSKYGGNGRLRSMVVAIRAGSVDLVIILTRWLGHSESRVIVEACRAAGVPVRLIAGGVAAAVRAVSAHFDPEGRRGG